MAESGVDCLEDESVGGERVHESSGQFVGLDALIGRQCGR